MIKNKLFILSCARYCATIIILFLLLLSPRISGSAARGAAALSDEILSTPETLKPFLETVYQQSLDRGFKNYYPYSFALIRECYQALAAGQHDTALLYLSTRSGSLRILQRRRRHAPGPAGSGISCCSIT